MFTKLARQICVIGLCLGVCGAANATFHEFRITQLYSNADGTVQFVELTALAGGQEFLGGHTLTSSNGAVTNSFTFPSNLPGDTANKTFLIGTQGFAALGVVTPDYIVPNGFLFTANGMVNYGEFADTWSYTSLPTDGSLALNRNGTMSVNSPRNFAGATGTVSIADYSGAWSNASENGWGLSVVRGASGAYGVIMYHYNQSSNPTWYFMSGGSFNGTTYSARVTLYSGSWFGLPSFNSPPPSDVGPVTINFTSATAATITYTISGTTVTKPLTKLQF